MSRFLILGTEGMACSLAWRLHELEGHDVRMWIQDKDSLQHMKGMVPHVSTLQEGLLWCGKNGIIIRDDESDCSAFRKAGYRVYGGNQWTERMEKDRIFQYEQCKRVGLKLPDYHKVESVTEAIRFVKANPDAWCLKQLGHAPKEWNYVGKEDDGSDMILQLEWIQQHPMFSQLGNVPFCLQEKVDGIEFAVGAWWCDGDWFTTDDGKVLIEENFEHKKSLTGDLGISCGEMGTVTRFVTDSKLYDEMLEPLTKLLKQNAAGVVVSVDANCGITEDGDAYLYEITPRLGYPAHALHEHLMDTDTGDFYEMLMNGGGDVQWKTGWCVGTCIGASDYPHESIDDEDGHSFRNQPVYFPDLSSGHVCPEYIWYDKGKDCHRIADDYGWVATVCHVDDSPIEANKRCVDAMKQIEVRAPVYRLDIGTKVEVSDMPKLKEFGYIE